MRTLLLWLTLLLPLSAAHSIMRLVHDPATDTRVEVSSVFSQPAHFGFHPVRVTLANRQNRSHAIQLDFNSMSRYDGVISCHSSFAISAPPGKTVVRDLLVPLCPEAENSYGQKMLRVSLSGSLGKITDMETTRTTSKIPYCLMSEALDAPNSRNLLNHLRSVSGRSYGADEFASTFPPKELPSQWLAYSGYESILLTEEDWNEIPAASRQAMFSWMRLGGQIVIYSKGSPTPSSLGLPAETGHGLFNIVPIKDDLVLDPAEVISLVDKKNPVRSVKNSLYYDYQSTTWPLQRTFGTKTFDHTPFVAVLILFAILVGPVNLFVFAKSGRRHRLFFTTPIISLATSALLVALIISIDGFGGHGMRRVLMEIPSENGDHAAYIHQEQISRSGIITNSRFTLDPACLMLPAAMSPSRWTRYTNDYNTKGEFHLQPGNGTLSATGDWWQSRTEQAQLLSAVVPTRGRIEATATPGTLVSTFDFPIESLLFLDADGQWHQAKSISTGKPFILTPCDVPTAKGALKTASNLLNRRHQGMLERAAKRPGHFFATTRHAPGLDTLPGIHWDNTETILTGSIVK